ncbi:MmgE/PrpD family protein [Candidatus Entotheonella serta]|nr:MmgE/PrpD family protein [Candidatus Entotheonella serta]
MSITRELAERILALQYEDLPEEAIYWAKQAVIDTIGVTFAGSCEPTARIPARIPGMADQTGPCLVLGGRQRTTALDAAMLNGVASHALDYDDVSPTMGGHPSVMLVIPIIALGEMFDTHGREAITAYVAGYEAATKVAQAVNFVHYEKGWHPTATLGIFGTTAVAARLMGLDVDQTARALAISVSLASGVKANFGTMTKPLHVGQSTRNGLFAAFLAKDDFTANPDAFEHKQGFFEVFNGAGNYDPAKMFDTWANPLDVIEPGLRIKQFPCCGSTHMAITMMLNLKDKHGLTPEQVRRVEIYTHPQRLPHTDRPTVSSALEAKFSVQYCVARALMHGKVLLDHFEGDAWANPHAQALLKVMQTGPHSTMTDKPWCAEVIVETHDGRRLSEQTEYLMGRGRPNPMSEAEMWVKFEDCVSRVLPAEQIAQLFAELGRFESLDSIRQLTALCEPQGLPANQAAD